MNDTANDKMIVLMIVAMDQDGLTRRAKGPLPWWGKIPKDMEKFQEVTTGKALIMGRKTFYAIPEKYRPLPGRTNIVLTRNPCVPDPNDYFEVGTAGEALQKAEEENSDSEIVIGGGAEIYELFLPIADVIYITVVENRFEKQEGDVLSPFSPASLVAEGEWLSKEVDILKKDEKNSWDLTFFTFEKA